MPHITGDLPPVHAIAKGTRLDQNSRTFDSDNSAPGIPLQPCPRIVREKRLQARSPRHSLSRFNFPAAFLSPCADVIAATRRSPSFPFFLHLDRAASGPHATGSSYMRMAFSPSRRRFKIGRSRGSDRPGVSPFVLIDSLNECLAFNLAV